jgi:hypothetical protein
MNTERNPEEEKALKSIMKIKGLNIHILKLALYHYRKINGICVDQNCHQPVVEGKARCAKHLIKSRELSKKYSMKKY